MTRSLNGRVAVITGAGSGMGRSMALRLAEDDAKIAIWDINGAGAEETAQMVRDAGGTAIAITADCSDRDAIKAAADRTRAELGNIAILVNNAGIAPFVSFADTTEAVLDEIYTVNFKSLFFVTQEAVKRLRDGGRIVSTSSGASRTPLPAVAAYSALKAPIDNLSKSLAVELGPREITVNVISPGVIDTDMAAAFTRSDEGQEFAKSKQALKRIGQTDDIARVAGFLAGPDSGWVTGQVIDVSGGSRL